MYRKNNPFLILVKQYCGMIHDDKKCIFHIIIYILRVRYMLLLSWLFFLHPPWQYEKLYSSYFYNKEQDVRGNITQKSCGLASSKRPSIATVISRTHLVCMVCKHTLLILRFNSKIIAYKQTSNSVSYTHLRAHET